jgi:hypothetical protein
MDDLDAWLDDYQPHETSATVCSANHLFAEHAAAESALVAAQGADDIHAAAELVAEIEAKIETASRTFTFRSVPTLEWADLIAAHPPTAAQLKTDPLADHNPETFPPAATAASSADGLTVPQVETMRRKLQHAEWLKVWSAVLQANLGVLAPPKSMLAGVVLRRNGGSATTAAQPGSPDPSS